MKLYMFHKLPTKRKQEKQAHVVQDNTTQKRQEKQAQVVGDSEPTTRTGQQAGTSLLSPFTPVEILLESVCK